MKITVVYHHEKQVRNPILSARNVIAITNHLSLHAMIVIIACNSSSMSCEKAFDSSEHLIVEKVFFSIHLPILKLSRILVAMFLRTEDILKAFYGEVVKVLQCYTDLLTNQISFSTIFFIIH